MMQKDIKNSITALKQGELVLMPTDTYWSIACDAKNGMGLSKMYRALDNDSPRNLTLFVADDRMLKQYVAQVPFAAQSIIDVADTPTTIIYDNPRNLAANLKPADNTIAIRIPDDDFCYELSRKLNGPVAIATANKKGNPTPKSFREIKPAILKDVDYIVNLHQEKISSKSAAIIKISNNGIVKVIRK